jgi:uncharacterized membrane protein HdeD (DUF308 family)
MPKILNGSNNLGALESRHPIVFQQHSLDKKFSYRGFISGILFGGLPIIFGLFELFGRPFALPIMIEILGLCLMYAGCLQAIEIFVGSTLRSSYTLSIASACLVLIGIFLWVNPSIIELRYAAIFLACLFAINSGLLLRATKVGYFYLWKFFIQLLFLIIFVASIVALIDLPHTKFNPSRALIGLELIFQGLMIASNVFQYLSLDFLSHQNSTQFSQLAAKNLPI